MNVFGFLSGKKSYLLVVTILAVVGVEKGLGVDVPGIQVDENWMELVFAALGLGTLRSGIATSVAKALK